MNYRRCTTGVYRGREMLTEEAGKTSGRKYLLVDRKRRRDWNTWKWQIRQGWFNPREALVVGEVEEELGNKQSSP